MARPLKEGLDYFPLDCVMDDKIEALEAEYGIEAFGVYVRILQSIYRASSGKLDLNGNDFSMWKILEKRTGKSEEYLKNVINFMINVGLFNKEIFESMGILTSNGIKKRIKEIDKNRRKTRIKVKKYRSNNCNQLQPSNNPQTTGESKVKESKVNKSNISDFEFLKNENFSNCFKDYLDMRKKIRKPATKKAEEMALKELHKQPIDIAIKMLNQSTFNSWQGIFPLKETPQVKQVHKEVKTISDIERSRKPDPNQQEAVAKLIKETMAGIK